MIEHYRGHSIQLVRARQWDAVITHLESDVMLPTKATATLGEGGVAALVRARDLVDLYLDGTVADSVAAPAENVVPLVVMSGVGSYMFAPAAPRPERFRRNFIEPPNYVLVLIPDVTDGTLTSRPALTIRRRIAPPRSRLKRPGGNGSMARRLM